MLWIAKRSENKAQSQVSLCLENTQVQAVLASNAEFLRTFTVRILQITSIHFGQVFTEDTNTNICTEIQLIQTLVAENKRDYWSYTWSKWKRKRTATFTLAFPFARVKWHIWTCIRMQLFNAKVNILSKWYDLPLVPVIEKHPESCTVQLGRDCKLFCHVTGKNLKYRWYRRSRCLEGEVIPSLILI